MISAYISNLGKYNEGILTVVEPLRLPSHHGGGTGRIVRMKRGRGAV